MAALWMCLRSQLRARRRATLALGLMLAAMAGAATAAAAGARRTETAYPRFVERYNPYDAGFSTGGNVATDELIEQVAAIPQVLDIARERLFYGSIRTRAGKEAHFPDVFFFGSATQFSVDRPGDPYKIVAGRDLNPRSTSELVVNYAMAERLALRPGDRVTMSLQASAAIGGEERDPSLIPPPIAGLELDVVGISAALGGFEGSIGVGFPTTITVSHAFVQKWNAYADPQEDNINLILRRGKADVDAFTRELEARQIPTDGPPTSANTFTKDVQDLNRVPAVALWLLCAFLALTTIAVFSQLLVREAQLFLPERPALRALGLSRRQLFALSLMRAGAIAVVGALLSTIAAFLFSPLTPVGLARIAEPDPGFSVDPVLFAAGAGVTFILVLLVSLIPAWSSSNATADGAAVVRSSRTAERLSNIGLPSSVQSGVRLAIDPGRGERAVPVRTATLGMAIAITALAAALGFALSLGKLIDTPRLAGYSWDAGAIANAFSAEDQAVKLPRLQNAIRRAMPRAEVWRGTVFSLAAVDRLELGAYVSDGPAPSVVTGRAPRGTSEVALDPRTLRQLRKKIGDRVTIANVLGPGEHGSPHRMKIVGTFVVPRIAFQNVGAPGQGVALTPEAQSVLNPGSPYADTIFVRFAPGTDFDGQMAALRAADPADTFALVSRAQSATVGNVSRLSSLPLILALIVGLLGVATLAHALTTTIRRRRRDLAILKTLGYVRRQLRAAVAWQCTTLIVVALAIGVPAGMAAGRWGWRLFATQLAVVPLPVVSAVAALGIIGGAILLGNLIALGPGLAAARTPAAVVLRTE